MKLHALITNGTWDMIRKGSQTKEMNHWYEDLWWLHTSHFETKT